MFKVGDRVQSYRCVRDSFGPHPVKVGHAVGTVIAGEVESYNRKAGCDMLVRLDDGRVGAACSREWRRFPVRRPRAGSWEAIESLGWKRPTTAGVV